MCPDQSSDAKYQTFAADDPPLNVMRMGVHRREHQSGHMDTSLSEIGVKTPKFVQLWAAATAMYNRSTAGRVVAVLIAETTPYCIRARQT